MKELLTLAFHFRFKQLLITPTGNTVIQAFRALFAGAVGAITDIGIMWIVFKYTPLNEFASASISFVFGVLANYVLSVKFVFSQKASVGVFKEIAIYFAVSLVGLGLTLAVIWMFTENVFPKNTDSADIYLLISKVIATVIAFFWNFTSRKLILYQNKV